MYLYHPTDERVEVSGSLVMSYIHAIDFGQETRQEMFSMHGVSNPNSTSWHPWAQVLNTLQEFEQSIGEKMLYLLCSSVIKKHPSEKSLMTMKEAFNYLDQFFKSTHRGGDFGSLKLDELNEAAQFATFNVASPYPNSKIDGIVTGALRKTGLKPKSKVTLISTDPTDSTKRRFELTW